MTVYVDDMYAPFGRMKMCHMVADSHGELMLMATAIGLEDRYIQDEYMPHEHFDVSMAKRKMAVGKGAREITMKELAAILAKKEETRRQE